METTGVGIALLNKLEILRQLKRSDWSPNEIAYFGIDLLGWELTSSEVVWLSSQLD
jgi:hypothetical protein